MARSRSAIWVGIAFVLTAGIARQYDQSYILEAPARWFIGPLLFSTVTGTFLFGFVYLAIIRPFRDHDEPHAPLLSQWRSFMGCYWMTAPIAWLYAIPTERFLSPTEVVVANFILLAVVAAWRVALMIKVISVVTRNSVVRTLPWVMAFASGELLVATIFGRQFERRILQRMAGLENSPEEELLRQLLGAANEAAFFSLLLWFVLILIQKVAFKPELRPSPRSFPKPEEASFPWFSITAVFLFWGCVGMLTLKEQQNSFRLARMIETKNYRGALDFIALNGTNAFAPSPALPPKLFELEMYVEMSGIIRALKPDDPEWMRQFYFSRLESMFAIKPIHFWRDENKLAMEKLFDHLGATVENRNWLAAHKKQIEAWFEKSHLSKEKKGPDVKGAFEAALRGDGVGKVVKEN